MIILAALDTDGTLTDRRQTNGTVQFCCNARRHLQPDQAGAGQNNGVILTIVQFAQACANITTQILNLQIRPPDP